jgi:hypothetical protein
MTGEAAIRSRMQQCVLVGRGLLLVVQWAVRSAGAALLLAQAKQGLVLGQMLARERGRWWTAFQGARRGKWISSGGSWRLRRSWMGDSVSDRSASPLVSVARIRTQCALVEGGLWGQVARAGSS